MPASTSEATSSAILGPFWREEAPTPPNGASIVQGGPPGETVLVQGRVFGADGRPLEGAIVNVWETAPYGSTSSRTRTSRTTTCVVSSGPTRTAATPSAPIVPSPTRSPSTGPRATCCKMMDRHPYRPSHFHFRVRAPGHQELVTQIFDREDKYVDND